MIRVALFDGSTGVKYIEFKVVPVERADEFRCIPDGLLSFEDARAISLELSKGRIRGSIERVRWYRQAGT